MDIGTVLKIKIEGEFTSCIIIGDMIAYSWFSTKINYLDLGGGPYGHNIINDIVGLRDYYKALIGDKIVYVETRDIPEFKF